MKIIICILALSILSFMNAQVSYACSCIGPRNATEGLAKSEAAFSGRVITSDEYTAEVEVERIWKGKITNTRITVINPAPNSSCSIALSQGERYIIFASIEKEGEQVRFVSQICNYTSVLSRAQQILEEIGKGRPVRKRRT